MKRTGDPYVGCFDRKYKLKGHHAQKECRDRNRLEAYAGRAFGCSTTAHLTRHGDQPSDPF